MFTEQCGILEIVLEYRILYIRLRISENKFRVYEELALLSYDHRALIIINSCYKYMHLHSLLSLFSVFPVHHITTYMVVYSSDCLRPAVLYKLYLDTLLWTHIRNSSRVI